MTGLIIDNFAGGGGASTGIEAAMGRPIDIAINHDPEAVAMHKINHPKTKHYCESVWDINPREVTAGRPIDLVWLSPDCKHFSKAKGGKPVEKKIRGLAWVALRWASLPNKPRCIMLENVEEFVTWGPVIVKEDGLAYPDPSRRGITFRSFVNALKRQGFTVEWRELRACDYGAPTSRKRLFLIARSDGQPVVWPTASHGKGLQPYRTAASIIDWSQPCPSIFERKRPLKEKTLARIARGIKRYVVEAAQPFIVPITHTASGDRAHPIDEPLRTITTAKGGEFALCVPTIVDTAHGDGHGRGAAEWSLHEPLRATTGKGSKALVSAFIAQHNGGNNDKSGSCGRQMDLPLSTITGRGTQQQLVTSHMIKLRGDNTGSAADEPLHTISAQGTHHGEVRAFLLKYYGSEKDGCDLLEPLHTITSKDRFGLVMIHGQPYQIVDIGMRMLTSRELYNAQGFPTDYIISHTERGPLTKVAQVRMCGNSVSPPLPAALIRANRINEAPPRMQEAA